MSGIKMYCMLACHRHEEICRIKTMGTTFRNDKSFDGLSVTIEDTMPNFIAPI